MKKQISVSLALISLIGTAEAGWFSKKPPKKTPEPAPVAVPLVVTEPTVESTEAQAPTQTEMKSAFDTATKSLSEVQGLMDSKKYTEARTKARKLVLEIHSNVGIESKTPEIIDASDCLGSDDIKKSYRELTPKSKFCISKVTKERKSGYFLDLVNLSKRANLLYLKAGHMQLAEMNRITERDTEYLRRELIRSHVVPLYYGIKIQNEYIQSYFLAFDSEVSDEIIQYEFNRELLDLALEVKELNYTVESFEKALEEYRLKTRGEHAGVTKEIAIGIQRRNFSDEVEEKFIKSKNFKFDSVRVIDRNKFEIINPIYNSSSLTESGLELYSFDTFLNNAFIGDYKLVMKIGLEDICKVLGFNKLSNLKFKESKDKKRAVWGVVYHVPDNGDRGDFDYEVRFSRYEYSSGKIIDSLYCEL